MSHIIQFYKAIQPDDKGRYITDIRKFSNAQLEQTHDFIQWLFPLTEPSGVNANAPILTQQDINLFKQDTGLQQGVLLSLEVMLKFYGIRMESIKRMMPAEDAAARTAEWITPGNHNFLRITRILKFLQLLGMQDVAMLMFRNLQELRLGKEDTIGDSYKYWQDVVK